MEDAVFRLRRGKPARYSLPLIALIKSRTGEISLENLDSSVSSRQYYGVLETLYD
jgi:hypothetical protein